ncbi:hypothetical protein BGW36DRAFT_424826 [Talaromyces proteolyticus]|uniref:Ribonucleases P/MRP subunit Pop8-like domain-containing protein n=1 Tax=Talaromyces proteolyticus TaxID=1131652 RepID=A0AAD4L3J4_9EURO|nr:uncharacterized protein BGW36DRAFT_424826 [Talaromyces proteolyticus]KAH8702554.1 hypothetical protein BGW36DRAFT_424826 [Talaromyces proteolyticus]
MDIDHPKPSTTHPKQHIDIDNDNVPATTRRITARNPPWTYLKLQLITEPITRRVHLDALTARTHLSAALAQFLGLMGTAVSIDILKIEDENGVLWIRVPREDGAAVVAAVSSWVGSSTTSSGRGGVGEEEEWEEGGAVAWRVLAKGNFLGAVAHGSGGDVFEP